jgi:Rrf2 family protein
VCYVAISGISLKHSRPGNQAPSIRISQQSEYALPAIFDLAHHRPEELVKVSSIASRQGIPQKFLESILLSLRHGGFVHSRRGRDGGYR